MTKAIYSLNTEKLGEIQQKVSSLMAYAEYLPKPRKAGKRQHNPPRILGGIMGFGASWLLSDLAKAPFEHPYAKVAASATVDVSLLLGANVLQRWIGYDQSVNTGIKWGATVGLLFSIAKIVKEDDQRQESPDRQVSPSFLTFP